MKYKVSFDFDGTLGDRADVQEYCIGLIANPMFEVHICTMRCSKPNNWLPYITPVYWEEVWELADKMGIKREHIHFTEGNEKDWFFRYNQDFLWHLDDDNITCQYVQRCKVPGICVFGNNNWKIKCERIIKRKCLTQQQIETK